jgi:hypothetical protein
VGRIRQAQVRVKWRAFVKTIMNLRVPLKKKSRILYVKLSDHHLSKECSAPWSE